MKFQLSHVLTTKILLLQIQKLYSREKQNKKKNFEEIKRVLLGNLEKKQPKGIIMDGESDQLLVLRREP